jgi:predicted transcriptional regulator
MGKQELTMTDKAVTEDLTRMRKEVVVDRQRDKSNYSYIKQGDRKLLELRERDGSPIIG